MYTMIVFTMVFLANLGPQSIGFNDFTEPPKVPFEATTFEQDALIKEAAAMRVDNQEKEPTAACDQLIADETLPFELRSWAVRQKMKLCTYARREREAIKTGRDWVDKHGDEDDFALEIRAVMGQIISQRGHPGFVPSYDEAKAVFDDIFEHHPADTMLVIQSHFNYAMLLEKLGLMNGTLNVLGVQHCGLAVTALENYLDAQRETLPEALRTQYEGRIAGIDTLAQRLMKKGTSNAMTEEEYQKAFTTTTKETP